jgi:G-patch domain
MLQLACSGLWHCCPAESALCALALQRGSVAARYGGFEAHTTGFGSRMMARWGFGGAGSGLGASQQGATPPPRSHMRQAEVSVPRCRRFVSMHAVLTVLSNVSIRASIA